MGEQRRLTPEQARAIADAVSPETWREMVALIKRMCDWYDTFVADMVADAESHANQEDA